MHTLANRNNAVAQTNILSVVRLSKHYQTFLLAQNSKETTRINYFFVGETAFLVSTLLPYQPHLWGFGAVQFSGLFAAVLLLCQAKLHHIPLPANQNYVLLAIRQ